VLAARKKPRPQPVFVLGSQRSGTRLPLVVLERARDIITYSDGSSPFFDGVMLKPDNELARLLERQPFPIVVLKPICDSHRALDLLTRFPGARVIWIFRWYQDAVNSASAKWRSGRRVVQYLASRDVGRAGWRAGGFTDEKFDLVRRLYSDDMSLHAANAVMWYLRNSLYLDMKLASRADVLLVEYEDLALNPSAGFKRIFDFVGCAFRCEFVDQVYASSVGRSAFPAIPDEIKRLCDDVHQRLTTAYRSQCKWSETTIEPGSPLSPAMRGGR
jgi:hypothetical protein